MSEEEQIYEFNTEYEQESSIESKRSIPPISTFTKTTSNGSEGYPTPLDTQSMANLESNNNDSSNTDSSSESMSVASPSQQQKQSQQPQETQQPAQHQQLLQQPQAYNNPVAGFPYTNQVLVTSTSPETNGVLAPQVIPSGSIPAAMAPSPMSVLGHTVIPFMTSGGPAPAPSQGMIQTGAPEQMMPYSTSAMHLLTSGAQPVYSMPAPVSANASVIQVNDTIPVQPTVLPHNIDLHQHLQQQQQQPPPPPPKNGSAEDKDDEGDDSRKITLATLVSHTQMQPPIQGGANPRPGLPPHLMQLNPPPQTTHTVGGPVPQHFIPGPGPIPMQGSIATGSYGNAQVLPPQQQQQQVPTSVVCMPPHIGPPPHGMVEQPNPMIGAGPGPAGMGMPAGVEENQQGPGSSTVRRNNKRRGNKREVPTEEKDARYFERRDRNNKAAKRSRDARKIREEQVGMRAHYLEKENDFLRAQLNTLREEANSLRLLLAQRPPPVNQMPPSGPPPMQ